MTGHRPGAPGFDLDAQRIPRMGFYPKGPVVAQRTLGQEVQFNSSPTGMHHHCGAGFAGFSRRAALILPVSG